MTGFFHLVLTYSSELRTPRYMTSGKWPKSSLHYLSFPSREWLPPSYRMTPQYWEDVNAYRAKGPGEKHH